MNYVHMCSTVTYMAVKCKIIPLKLVEICVCCIVCTNAARFTFDLEI